MNTAESRTMLKGVGYLPTVDMADRNTKLGQKPEPHVLEYIGTAIGLPVLDRAVGPLVNRDSAWSRFVVGARLDEINMALETMKPSIVKAQSILADADLTAEAKTVRASSIILTALEAVRPKLESIIKNGAEYALWTDKCIAAVFEIPDDTQAQADARECREVLRGMDESQRAPVLLKLAKDGNAAALAAIQADPLKQLAGDGEIMARAKDLCLESSNQSWLLAQRDDAHKALEHLAMLADVTYGAIVSTLDVKGVDRNQKNFAQIAEELLNIKTQA